MKITPSNANSTPQGGGTPGGPAGGDLGGTYPGPTVVSIGGVSISAFVAQFLKVVGGGIGTVVGLGSLGATETVDISTANAFTGTLNANCTIGFSNITAGDVQITLYLTEDGTGGWTPTFSGVTWIGGPTPVHTTTAGTVTIYVFLSVDGGTTIYGDMLGAGASFATPAIVLGTAAAAGSAATVIRSDSTIVAFDATVGTPIGTTASAGAGALASRNTHVHNITAAVLAAHGVAGEVLMVDGVSSPPEPIQTEDGTAWLYADLID